MQQLENGALLGAAYKEALGLKQGPAAAAASGALVVESTKFQRTILSAAAIVTGLCFTLMLTLTLAPAPTLVPFA
jgi:hypothetical protein